MVLPQWSYHNNVNLSSIMFFIALSISLFIVCFLGLKFFLAPKKLEVLDKHVIITGGSSGIGKAVAQVCLTKGASVSLLARNQDKLQNAAKELMQAGYAPEKIQVFPIDVAGSEKDVKEVIAQAEEMLGPCSVLICSAGITSARTLENTSLSEFKRVIDINLFGTVCVIRAVLPGMLARRSGSIALISSMAGQLGIYGYSAYSASKFALRGLAESLQMEVKHRGVNVSLIFPPDTDTPMLQEEMKDRPLACQQISNTAGLWNSSQVAESLVADIEHRRFLTWFGLDGMMLTTVTAGMSPANLIQAFFQVLTIGLFRLVGLFYVSHFYRVARRADERERKQR